jgi:hypothetical protein
LSNLNYKGAKTGDEEMLTPNVGPVVPNHIPGPVALNTVLPSTVTI